jgi:esterase/lipase
LKRVQKNGELFWCPDCDELRPTTSKPLVFPTKENYAKKMPTSLQKYEAFSKSYQSEIEKFKTEFSMLEHQFIEIKSEMVTALGLKDEVFDKLDNIRPVNKVRRYDTYHYYLEKGSHEPEMSYMTTKRGFDD